MKNKKLSVLLGKTIISVVMLFGLILVLSLVVQGIFEYDAIANFITPIGLGLTALLMYVFFERKKGWSIGWKDRHGANKAFIGFIIVSIFFAITMSIMLLTGTITVCVHDWEWGGVSFYVILFLLVAIGEEWLFRGYYFGLYKSQVGTKTAVIVNSFLFTVIHLLNPEAFTRPFAFIAIEMVNIFLLSLIMSLARLYSGTIWMPIGIHFSMNVLQSSIFGFVNGGKEVESLFYMIYESKTIFNGAGYGLESSLIFTPVLMVTCGLITVYGRRK